MQLIRKWNPKDALYINNPNGPKVYRILALVKDGVNSHYVCFYDSWTLKVYIEEAHMQYGSSYFDNTSMFQVKDDKEWQALVDFLSEDQCKVIQMVQTSIENELDPNTGQKTGEFKIHDAMDSLPRTKYGVDVNGKQSITGASPIDMQMSPSLTDGKGGLITDFSKYKD
jgi:hypothetical protein